jgi:hypothetical protein
MKRFLAIGALAAFVLGADTRGLKPRPAAADYAVQETHGDLTLGAAVLTPDEVKSALSTDLKQYIVLEVGVYPAAGKTIELNPHDFALRAGEQGNIVRAAAPQAIAASNQRKNSPAPRQGSGRDVTLYPTATVGVANGPDPVTGRNRTGVYTGAGVGVGVGGNNGPAYPDPPRPGSTDRDREVMQQELADMMLPEGQFTAPVSGYLYFPIPQKARTAALELQYFGAGGKVRVALPPLPKGK